MPAIVEPPRAELRATLEGFLGDGIPQDVTVPWICAAFGVTAKSVRYAIKTGKLPHRRVESMSGGTSLYLIRPEDAMLLWGYRLMPRNDA